MEFLYTDHAVCQLKALEHAEQVRIAAKMRFFADQKDPLVFAKPLKGYRGMYRFRVGDLRIIFETKDAIAYILLIGKRDGVYKNPLY